MPAPRPFTGWSSRQRQDHTPAAAPPAVAPGRVGAGAAATARAVANGLVLLLPGRDAGGAATAAAPGGAGTAAGSVAGSAAAAAGAPDLFCSVPVAFAQPEDENWTEELPGPPADIRLSWVPGSGCPVKMMSGQRSQRSR